MLNFFIYIAIGISFAFSVIIADAYFLLYLRGGFSEAGRAFIDLIGAFLCFCVSICALKFMIGRAKEEARQKLLKELELEGRLREVPSVQKEDDIQQS